MNSPSSDVRGQERSIDEFGTTRRAVLAAGGAVALTGLAGCSALDGLLDRAGEQVVGTTASAPAAFYPGRPESDESSGTTSAREGGNERQVLRTSPGEVKQVPATARADGREIELEGWAISASTKAQDYNSSRSNHPSTEWWPGPDDDDDDDDDILVAIHDIELQFLHHVVTAQDAVDQRAPEEAKQALGAFIATTENALRPELDKCGTGVCETVRENSDSRVQGVQAARDAIDDGDWDAAASELADIHEIVLGDIERLDDELVERHPDRPRFIDIIRYLRGELTIGERFTVCLPDAKLPGDRGSLAQELTLDHVLAYFAPSRGPDGLRAPFHDRYGTQGISYGEEHCIQLDAPISLHRDISCGTVLSAELDTYTTENRAIAGFSTEGGAVVSGAPASADTVGKRVFLAGDDVTGEIILGEDRDMVMPGDSDGDGSVTPTLVCPVTVTPEDCPCPLPGLFFVRRIVHDDQVIFAGGWTLDDGALFDHAVTLLFDEGPTEVASVTPEDIESDDYDNRLVEQFSRDRSQHGSAVISGDLDAILESGGVPKAQLTAKLDTLLGTGDDEGPTNGSLTALDAPLVHLDGARELSDEEKLQLGRGIDKKDIRRGM